MLNKNNGFGLRTAIAIVFPDLYEGNYLDRNKSVEEIKMQEQFKSIKGYEELYEISNFGRVKSFHGKKPIILKPLFSDDYLMVILHKNNKAKAKIIHAIVWDTFGNKKRNGMILQIDHLDNDKQNNRIDNLQLLSHRQNVSKGFIYHKKKTSKYTGVSWSKISKKWQSQISENNKHYSLGFFEKEIDAYNEYNRALKELKETGKITKINIRHKTSKYNGVSRSKYCKKWLAGIKINGKRKHLGYFTDEYEAHLAYQKALAGKMGISFKI